VTPLLIALIHIGDLFMSTVGKAIAKRAQCRFGDHDWEQVAGSEFLRYCTRCGLIDDTRKNGIESDREINRIKARRKTYRRETRRESIRERRARAAQMKALK